VGESERQRAERRGWLPLSKRDKKKKNREERKKKKEEQAQK